jgi:hypothetical protein
MAIRGRAFNNYQLLSSEIDDALSRSRGDRRRIWNGFNRAVLARERKSRAPGGLKAAVTAAGSRSAKRPKWPLGGSHLEFMREKLLRIVASWFRVFQSEPDKKVEAVGASASAPAGPRRERTACGAERWWEIAS